MTTTAQSSAASIDLRVHFGARYRVCWEANGTTRSAWPEAEQSWLLELLCKYGVVYPQGGAILAATITSRKIGNMVAALPCIRTSRGDVERVVTFHLDDANAVLELLRPSQRRQIFPEARARLVAMGHRHRFHGADRVETRLESTRTSEDDPGGQPELDVIVAAPDVVPSEGMGARRSPPAEELDVPGADRLATEPRRGSASHGLKVRG